MVNEYIKNTIKKIKHLIAKEKDFQTIYSRKADKRIAIELVVRVVLLVTIILGVVVLFKNVNLIEEEQSKTYEIIAFNSDKITFLDGKEIRRIDTKEVNIFIDLKEYLKRTEKQGILIFSNPFTTSKNEIFRIEFALDESWELYTIIDVVKQFK